jgi:extracellular elastinolytic metalloproteinase
MVTPTIPVSWRSRQLIIVVLGLLASIALILSPSGTPAVPSPWQQQPAPEPELANVNLPDLDTRATAPAIGPSAVQRDAAESLDATVRWTRFGTAQSLIQYGGFLATGIRGADPADAARAWLDDHRSLYRLADTRGLVVHSSVPLNDTAHVVVFRQLIGGVPIAPDGFASIGLVGSSEDGWSVAYASSTLVPQSAFAGTTTVSMRQAVATAASEAGVALDATDVTATGLQAGWQVVRVNGVEQDQLVRRVAFPVPGGTLRPAYETVYFDGWNEGYRSFVDAGTGQVRYRESIVQNADSDPSWDVYPARPPMTRLGQPPWGFPSPDQRTTWCWIQLPGCQLVLENGAARVPWDVDPRTGTPTLTSTGNAVDAAEWWRGAAGGPGQRPVSPERSYQPPWTNVWYESGCDSGNLVPGGNDIDASVTNLFAGNWRMHSWAYQLGFTEQAWNGQSHNFGINPAGEGDPVTARAQAGAISPGSRNNASMGTRPDGTSSIMNMFLWQPLASSFYGPCVVGDFDMSVVGHEYTHMIENRMIGKGGQRSGFHAGAMGESWADFVAMEYHNEYGLVAGDASGWTVGAYVTGNPIRGIRNYNMSYPSAGQFPQPGRDVRVGALNLGSMGYDITGPQVHSDGQIWSATNHDIRSLMLERYPGQGAVQQVECADGVRSAEACPGNRRWMQLVFDAMLLMPPAPTMLDARDAYFAADLLRFGGANQDLLWQGFARRGFGEQAVATGTQDTDPVPSFASPLHEGATLRFEAVDEDGQPVEAQVFAGDLEARATPVDAVEEFVPNPEGYNFVARAPGYGHVRFYVDDLAPGEERTITIHFPTNAASTAQGAVATGDGVRHVDLIDDTEATNWESTTRPVAGTQVTIALGGPRDLQLAKTSALLRPDQNRFTALRQFELYACTAGNAANPTCDGTVGAGWTRFLTSSRDAFPAPNPRPAVPDLLLRTFQIPQTTATHVKFVVVANQCTGNRMFQGEQHQDPATPSSDCRSTTVGAQEVRAAELQLLTSRPTVEGATLVD